VTSDLHPTEGIRLLLTLAKDHEGECGSATVKYDAAIYTTDSQFLYLATLSDDGTVALVAESQSANEPDEKQLRNICASIARAAKRKRNDDLPPWPARVLRWRGPGRGSTR